MVVTTGKNNIDDFPKNNDRETLEFVLDLANKAQDENKNITRPDINS